MLEKYRSFSDNDLVLEYKKGRCDDLENELICRYQKHAKLLAALLYTKYKFLYQVEFDDVYCILMGCLFPCIRRFDDQKELFYHYWKTVATNEVVLYVNNFSSSRNQQMDFEKTMNDEHELIGCLRQNSESLNDDYLTSFEIEEILTNPRYKLQQRDADMFRLYVGGYSIGDICNIVGEPYNQVRYRISIVRRKIANILFNQ